MINLNGNFLSKKNIMDCLQFILPTVAQYICNLFAKVLTDFLCIFSFVIRDEVKKGFDRFFIEIMKIII